MPPYTESGERCGRGWAASASNLDDQFDSVRYFDNPTHEAAAGAMRNGSAVWCERYLPPNETHQLDCGCSTETFRSVHPWVEITVSENTIDNVQGGGKVEGPHRCYYINPNHLVWFVPKQADGHPATRVYGKPGNVTYAQLIQNDALESPGMNGCRGQPVTRTKDHHVANDGMHIAQIYWWDEVTQERKEGYVTAGNLGTNRKGNAPVFDEQWYRRPQQGQLNGSVRPPGGRGQGGRGGYSGSADAAQLDLKSNSVIVATGQPEGRHTFNSPIMAPTPTTAYTVQGTGSINRHSNHDPPTASYSQTGEGYNNIITPPTDVAHGVQPPVMGPENPAKGKGQKGKGPGKGAGRGAKGAPPTAASPVKPPVGARAEVN